MLSKICFFTIVSSLCFTSSVKAMDHIDHCRHLLLQSEITCIKNMIIENSEYLPPESFKDILLHIHITEQIIDQV